MTNNGNTSTYTDFQQFTKPLQVQSPSVLSRARSTATTNSCLTFGGTESPPKSRRDLSQVSDRLNSHVCWDGKKTYRQSMIFSIILQLLCSSVPSPSTVQRKKKKTLLFYNLTLPILPRYLLRKMDTFRLICTASLCNCEPGERIHVHRLQKSKGRRQFSKR